jgi:hypothetical protein
MYLPFFTFERANLPRSAFTGVRARPTTTLLFMFAPVSTPLLTCLSACLFLHHPSLLVVTHGFHLLLLNVPSVRLQGHATALPPLHYSANCPVHILLSASVTSLPTKTKLHDRNITQHGCPPRSPLHFIFDHFDHFSATISCFHSPVTSSPSAASGE